jgi:hypothetical protein
MLIALDRAEVAARIALSTEASRWTHGQRRGTEINIGTYSILLNSDCPATPM